MTNWNSYEKKQLARNINNLSNTEHIEILKIIDKYKIQYTQNNNGVFVNISNLDDNILDEINIFIDFCIRNNEELDAYDKKIQECKNNNMFFNTNTTVIKHEISVIEEMKESEPTYTDAKFVGFLNNRIDLIHKKKTNSKFLNSKKKYSRKSTTCYTDIKKGDLSVLEYDEPLIKYY